MNPEQYFREDLPAYLPMFLDSDDPRLPKGGKDCLLAWGLIMSLSDNSGRASDISSRRLESLLPGRREKWAKALSNLEDQGFIKRVGRQTSICLPGMPGRFDDKAMTDIAIKVDPIWGQTISNGPKWGPPKGAKRAIEKRNEEIKQTQQKVSGRLPTGVNLPKVFYSRKRVLTDAEKQDFQSIPNNIKGIISKVAKNTKVDLRPKRNWDKKARGGPISLPLDAYVVEPEEE